MKNFLIKSTSYRRRLVPLFLLAFLPLSLWAAGAARPNVIVIFTDDQGTLDAGCYGAEDLRTPGIDSLAKTGVRFTQFYAAAPVCSPSRAGLLTGRYPLRAGIPNNVGSHRGSEGLPNGQAAIAEMMKAAGYDTARRIKQPGRTFSRQAR